LSHDRSNSKIVATIEARMTSSRCPGKVLRPLAGKPMLQRIVERLRAAHRVQDVVVATTTNATDDPVADLARSIGARCFRGSENDVLDRVLQAARSVEADVIVEITGDCPLVDPDVVDALCDAYRKGSSDYVSNVLKRTYPAGLDTQVFGVDALAKAAELGREPAHREHVSLFLYQHPELFKLENVEGTLPDRYCDLWFTVDYPEDVEHIGTIYDALHPTNPNFRTQHVLAWIDAHPESWAWFTRRPRAKSVW
jgi:spore coat polysaccharide biosynthesis protein SpsF